MLGSSVSGTVKINHFHFVRREVAATSSSADAGPQEEYEEGGGGLQQPILEVVEPRKPRDENLEIMKKRIKIVKNQVLDPK